MYLLHFTAALVQDRIKTEKGAMAAEDLPAGGQFLKIMIGPIISSQLAIFNNIQIVSTISYRAESYQIIFNHI